MTGTLVNIITVLIGSFLGIFFHSRLPQRYVKIVFQGLGLFTVYLGFDMASKTHEMLIMVFSIILGAITGELIGFENRIEAGSEWMKKKLRIGEERFSEGAVTAFLLFCVGSMTILGAIEEGLGGSPKLLITKSVMDGFASIALASAFGYGVAFSVVPLLIFQGGLTLSAHFLGKYLSQPVVDEMTAVGGLLLIGLAINILEIKKIKVLNLLPALLFSVFLSFVFPFFKELFAL